jgi:O-antigen/teichoic acid export membrane protein
LTIDFGSLMGQVVYPIFAKHVHRHEPVVPLLRATQISMTLLFTVMGIPLFIFTEKATLFLLGPQWLSIAPAIRWLYLACALKSFLSTWNTLSILGENLHHYVIMNLVMTLTMAVGILWLAPRLGVEGAGLAVLLSIAVIFPFSWKVLNQAVHRLNQQAALT